MPVRRPGLDPRRSEDLAGPAPTIQLFRSCTLQSANELVVAAASSFLQMPEDFVQVERGRLLTWREFHKGLDLLGHKPLHFVDDVGMGDQPIPVCVRVMVRALERIPPQVEDLRRSKFYKRLEPALQLLGSLLQKHDLPVAHPDAQDVAIIADVEEEISGAAFCLAGEIGQQVETVDMHLVGPVSHLMTLEELR